VPGTVADNIQAKLTPLYGPGTLAYLLGRFWADNPPRPRNGADLHERYRTEMAKVYPGGSVNDLEYEYWRGWPWTGSTPTGKAITLEDDFFYLLEDGSYFLLELQQDYFQLEDGFFYRLEDGSYIVLEEVISYFALLTEADEILLTEAGEGIEL
jgi:hypothetical protein